MVGVSEELQVIDVHAATVPAGVMDLMPEWDRTVVLHVDDTVDERVAPRLCVSQRVHVPLPLHALAHGVFQAGQVGFGFLGPTAQ